MNDQDIIDATRSSGIALSERSRFGMRSVLEAAINGDEIAELRMVPETAPTAKSTAATFDHRLAKPSATSSPSRIPRP